MRRHLVFCILVLASLGTAGTACGGWMFRPSYFSHNPATGQRIAQYAPVQTPYRVADATFLRSGYRHLRSSLRGADGSADRLHVVETWGAGEYIRPYGEWLRPFRAGATPYGPWGNPNGPWTSPFGSWVNPYGLGRLYGFPHWGLPQYGWPGGSAGQGRPMPYGGNQSPRPGGPDGDEQ
ncbi:MAG TPA: hypothetical protein EYP56_13280 [Planctomycetaceae bacterium]|nr:hypothetical protein [Planctomycetaceae bacterium]HIQ20452.1 hypothetical protein [Planctomycetota bacterium]